MKKVKHEKALLKKALEIGEALAQKSGYGGFDGTDSADHKAEAIYRMLVHLQLLTPLPSEQENSLHIRQRLAKWMASKLPEEHELRQ